MPGPPVDVALAAVWRRGPAGVEILLTRRAPGSHLPGLWELPGGKREAGETVAEAARRELREELGVSVGDLEPLVCVEHRYPDRTVRLHAMVTTLTAGGELTARDYRWAALDFLPAIPLPAANAPINEAISARLHGVSRTDT
jgi:8-oxo-dGTP diphosphatase